MSSFIITPPSPPPKQILFRYIYRNRPVCLQCLSVDISCKRSSSLTYELILMKLYLVVQVYDLRMCIKGDIPGLKVR